MTIPDRSQASRALCSLAPPEWFLRHACAVADVAAWIALRAETNGAAVDRQLVEAAALLHDVDKLQAAGTPVHLRHGEGSAAWLDARGWPELAAVVRDHPVTRLAEQGYGERASSASLEARIVAYADKRAGQRLEPMSARFASWRRRYPRAPDVASLGRVAPPGRPRNRAVEARRGAGARGLRRRGLARSGPAAAVVPSRLHEAGRDRRRRDHRVLSG